MKCPRKFNSNTLDRDGYTHLEACHCAEVDCAWFSGNRCAILAIADYLADIAEALTRRSVSVDVSGSVETFKG